MKNLRDALSPINMRLLTLIDHKSLLIIEVGYTRDVTVIMSGFQPDTLYPA